MNHRVASLIFALAVGLLAAWLSWRWVTDTGPRQQRAVENAMVLAARTAVRQRLGGDDLEIVDPLNPNRVAGKVFIYPADDGWEISGYYRRGDAGPWSPWLVVVDGQGRPIRVRTGQAGESRP